MSDDRDAPVALNDHDELVRVIRQNFDGAHHDIADAILARWRLTPVEHEPFRHSYHGWNGQEPCARCADDVPGYPPPCVPVV